MHFHSDVYLYHYISDRQSSTNSFHLQFPVVCVLFNGSCHVRCWGKPWVSASLPEEPPEFVGEHKFTSHGWVFLSIYDTVRSVHCTGIAERGR